jgi:hypothetical protein
MLLLPVAGGGGPLGSGLARRYPQRCRPVGIPLLADVPDVGVARFDPAGGSAGDGSEERQARPAEIQFPPPRGWTRDATEAAFRAL